MKPKDTFDSAMKRVDHLLRLYDLLHNTRTYKARSDWCAKFNDLMHWSKKETIVRVDGKDGHSILILRQVLGIDHTQFTHDYLSELQLMSFAGRKPRRSHYGTSRAPAQMNGVSGHGHS